MSAVAGAGPGRSGAWLFGRWTDLGVGCGLLYLLSIPILYAISETTGTSRWPTAFVVAFALLVNGPHYGATIVRVYDAAEDRRKYALFAVYVTLAISLLFAASTHVVWLASALITAYLTWSPWHFSGQNYGLTLMFLRRRGIDVDPVTKRLLYASFILSAVLAILAIHGGYEDFVFAPFTLHVPNAPHIFTLELPGTVAWLLRGGIAAAYLACVGAGLWRLSRRTTLRELAPALLLVLTQALWFTVPAVLIQWGTARTSTLVFSAIWVNAWHSLQYLWVTSYYARSSESREPAKKFLVKAAVAGTAVATLPGVVMAPQWLGGVPWDAGLAASLFAVVNLHHFILDGAIWKLRDGRVARVLLRPPSPSDPAAPLHEAPRRAWLRPLVWTAAALGILVPATEFAGKRALGRAEQPEEIERATQMLRVVGRETTEMHYWLGQSAARAGERERAIVHYERSLALFPTARVWAALGTEYRALGRWKAALEAFDAAVALNDRYAAAYFGRAQALLVVERGEPASQERAAEAFERGLEIAPNQSQAAIRLARLYLGMGQTERARATLERALAAEKPSHADAVRSELARLSS